MRLHAHEWGRPDAPPVVCLHGVTGHGRRFRKLAEERLAGRFRVVALDLRGHGRSGWEPPWDIETHLDDLVETAAALGIERASWIGHSFGGRLAVELAAREPALVERLALLDPALRLEPAKAYEAAEDTRADLSFASVEEAIATRYDSGLLFSTPRELLEEELPEHLEHGPDGRLRYRVCASAAIVAWSEMCTEPPRWPAAPGLVVLGESSWLSVDVPEGVETVTVSGGHLLLWDAFEETAAAVERFLAG